MTRREKVQAFKAEAYQVFNIGKASPTDIVDQAARSGGSVTFPAHGKQYSVEKKGPGLFVLRCESGGRALQGGRPQITAGIEYVMRHGALPVPRGPGGGRGFGRGRGRGRGVGAALDDKAPQRRHRAEQAMSHASEMISSIKIESTRVAPTIDRYVDKIGDILEALPKGTDDVMVENAALIDNTLTAAYKLVGMAYKLSKAPTRKASAFASMLNKVKAALQMK